MGVSSTMSLVVSEAILCDGQWTTMCGELECICCVKIKGTCCGIWVVRCEGSFIHAVAPASKVVAGQQLPGGYPAYGNGQTKVTSPGPSHEQQTMRCQRRRHSHLLLLPRHAFLQPGAMEIVIKVSTCMDLACAMFAWFRPMHVPLEGGISSIAAYSFGSLRLGRNYHTNYICRFGGK